MTPKATTQAAYAVAFATIFLLIGWQQLNPHAFGDLDAYRVGFQSQWYYFRTLNLGPIGFVMNEGVWVRSFMLLYETVGNIETCFLIVSFVSILLMGMYVLKRTESPLYLLFFFNPAFVGISIEQIRSALAAGIFWTAIRTKNVPLRIALLILPCTIHTAFFLFVGFYLSYALMRGTPYGRIFLTSRWMMVVSLMLVSLLISSSRDILLDFIGDTRAYDFLEYTSGIFLSTAWLGLAIIPIIYQDREESSFENVSIVFFSSMYVFSAFLGVYGSRYVAIIIPALAVACQQMSPSYRLVLIAPYMLFSGLYFFYWFGQV